MWKLITGKKYQYGSCQLLRAKTAPHFAKCDWTCSFYTNPQSERLLLNSLLPEGRDVPAWDVSYYELAPSLRKANYD